MSGTKSGGQAAARTNKQRYGDGFYARLGSLGGSVRTAKGFAKMPKEKVRAAGRKGGAISRRGPKYFVIDNTPFEEGFNRSWWRRWLRKR